MATIDRALPAGPPEAPARSWWQRVRPQRPVSQVAFRVLAMGGAALILAAVRIPHRPATLCFLRGTTGIPCPFCGGTTCAVEIGHGHVLAGFAANPLVFIATIVLMTSPLTGFMRWWDGLSGRTRVVIAVSAVTASELWQLGRFGLLF